MMWKFKDRKNIKKCFAYVLSAALLLTPIENKAFQVKGDIGLSIPTENSDINSIGATMPYTRYDTTQAVVGGGALVVTSNDFSKDNIASQASEQSYVVLPGAGAYAEWIMKTTGNGVTMRFTLPDTADGMGQDGSLDVYVNDKKVKTIDLTSYYMWQYFQYPNPYQNGHPDDKLEKEGSTGCFAFDEVHFMLDTSLKKDDRIRIQSTGKNGLVYGVDFLEIEEVGEKISKPDNAYSVTDYGAIPNDGKSDISAIYKCISAARSNKKDVYFPEGTFNLPSMWRLDASDIKITGAGMWYTNLQFTSDKNSGGGISGAKADNVEFCNMYINSRLRSRYEENAVYKCFMDIWSGGSYIHDIWEDHFECGFWLGDYYSGDGVDYSDGLIIANCRIRNNFADGVNLCQGTSNAKVYNCNIRNTGDDGLAMWNNSYLDVKDETNNVFCYNTLDFIWRAGAIAVYGGNGHKIYNNYIADTFMASGIHVNTGFDGYKFSNNKGITFSNNIIIRSGTSSDSWRSDLAAIDITEPNGAVKNITFNNTYIYDAQHDAVKVTGTPSNIVFNNLKVYGTGADGQSSRVGAKEYNNGALFKFQSTTSAPVIILNGLEYANIAYDKITCGKLDNCTIKNEKNRGKDYTYVIPVGTSKDSAERPQIPTESTTNKVETTSKQVSTTKQAATTKPKTTKAPLKSPGKAKVSKVNTKKKSARKIKLTLKKISVATKYQVKVYKSKSNAKKNKSALVSKTTTKYKNITISSKKLKNRKTLYVKARAYNKKGWGKWSTPKRVKIK